MAEPLDFALIRRLREVRDSRPATEAELRALTEQAEAWAGGGHGKRLDGWEGRRVVMACADCHDPHNPAVQTRIPFRAPQLERTGGYHP